jgi:hypothetical protein
MQRDIRVIASLSLLIALGIPLFAADAQDTGPAAPAKISRWESNLSAGAVLERRVGIVKSFWWHALPNVFAIGLSFDFVMPAIPLSVNAAVNAPLGFVTPFVCAGAGASLTVGGITNYGGGLKLRLGQKFGLVFEYRRYHYTVESGIFTTTKEKVAADYLGAGISWLY